MSTWHYTINGVQAGPTSTDELKSLLASAALPASALVWREGMAGWVPAGTLPEFAGVAPVAASALPSVAAAGAPGIYLADAADVEKNKVFGILSYLPPLLFIVGLIAARPSKFAMYHCNQGLVLTLVAFACGIANMILDMGLVFIPFLGWFLMVLLHFGLFIGIIVLAVMGIINAANGVCKPLPIIGNRFTLIK
ncbi:MAG: GYF domain-containing protein [Opitutaceae bacterium]